MSKSASEHRLRQLMRRPDLRKTVRDLMSQIADVLRPFGVEALMLLHSQLVESDPPEVAVLAQKATDPRKVLLVVKEATREVRREATLHHEYGRPGNATCCIEHVGVSEIGDREIVWLSNGLEQLVGEIVLRKGQHQRLVEALGLPVREYTDAEIEAYMGGLSREAFEARGTRIERAMKLLCNGEPTAVVAYVLHRMVCDDDDLRALAERFAVICDHATFHTPVETKYRA